MNRRYRPEEKLCTGWIRTRHLGVVQPASLRGMQSSQRGICGNQIIRVVAEPLNAPIPYIAMNVVIRPRRHHDEWNPPQSGQRETGENHLAREPRCPEELADGDKIGDAGNSEENKEGRSAEAAPRADRQRCKHRHSKPVESERGAESHAFPALDRRAADACLHSASQAAVRGALAGARCSSSASRFRSSATSMS